MTAYACKDEEQGKHFSTAGGSENLYSHLWESIWWFHQKLEINLPQNPAIPLLGIYLMDGPAYHKDIFSTTFIDVLFIIARNWKQPRCPPTEE